MNSTAISIQRPFWIDKNDCHEILNLRHRIMPGSHLPRRLCGLNYLRLISIIGTPQHSHGHIRQRSYRVAARRMLKTCGCPTAFEVMTHGSLNTQVTYTPGSVRFYLPGGEPWTLETVRNFSDSHFYGMCNQIILQCRTGANW